MKSHIEILNWIDAEINDCEEDMIAFPRFGGTDYDSNRYNSASGARDTLIALRRFITVEDGPCNF